MKICKAMANVFTWNQRDIPILPHYSLIPSHRQKAREQPVPKGANGSQGVLRQVHAVSPQKEYSKEMANISTLLEQ